MKVKTSLALSIVLVIAGCDFLTPPHNPQVEQSYEHIRPSWSPDGTTIAFTARIGGVLGLYLVDSTGNNLRLLKEIDGLGVCWSPDSRWLAFSSIGKLYRIKANGDSLIQLTNGPNDIRPSWSPDGQKIVFVGPDILMLDLSTKVRSLILSSATYPHWHPNGKEIIYQSTTASPYSNDLIYRIEAYNLETKNFRILASFRSIANWGFGVISSTGNEILISRQYEQERVQVWKINLLNDSFHQLTDDGGDFPSWNRNGIQFVYTRTQKGDGGLWVMNNDGSGKRRLTQP